MKMKSWRNRIVAVLLLAAVLATICLGGCSVKREPDWLSEPELLRTPIRLMLDSVSTGDYAAAGKQMQNQPDLDFYCPENAIGKACWDAFIGSIRYELVGEGYACGDGAAHKIRVTCLDLSAISESLPERVSALLEAKMAACGDISEVYDENREYRQELIDALTLEAIEAILTEEAKSITVELEVKLVCVDGQWKIVPDENLLKTITGGLWTGKSGSFDAYVSANQALVSERVSQVEKVFWLNDADVIAPKPNAACYGSTTDPSTLQWLLDDAAELLDGQKTLFTTDTEIMPGSEVVYYLDETILSITWRQYINGVAMAMSEIKIAHPSQFRRYLVDDTYGVTQREYGSDLAAQVNAVTASNADYYIRRPYGIIVYQGEVHRVNKKLDVCFVDDQGDLILVHQGEITDEETAKKFVEDNNIRFSMAFGPIIVEDGKNVTPPHYSIGEINGYFPRAALGTLGELHYLVATNGKTPECSNMLRLTMMADLMIAFGCDKAYNLDGGQTSLIVTNNRVMSYLSFSYERKVSDIIYFATAIPDGSGS